jgi:hypothetical protein
MENKQTAVQDLIKELEQFAKVPMVDKPTIEAAIEFTKLKLPIEKQQMIDAYLADRFPCSEQDAGQYYTETYKP